MSEPTPPESLTDVEWDVAELDCTDLSDDDALIYTAMAIEWLRAWTNNQYGLTTEVLRPCSSHCSDYQPPTFWGAEPQTYPRWGWTLIANQWYDVSCGMCLSGCSCSQPGLQLPGPVESVTEVLLDGVEFTDWVQTLDGTLVRLDGEPWPDCQNLLADSDQPGTWQVTYVRGRPVPIGGQVAASVLACELYRAAVSSTKCRLPQGLQSVSRQGVSMNVGMGAEIPGDKTGIWLIDSWVESVTMARSPVMSPDYGRRR